MYALFHPMRYAPDFVNWKILLRYSFVACFISTGYAVVKFKVFLLIHHPWKGPFLGFLALNSPKYCSILMKWWEVATNKTNTVFQKSFKLLNFGSNGTRPKFTVLVHFGAQFTARKQKILLKTRTCAKTTYRPTPLGISINVSLRSQKNHVILTKVNKKIFLGTQIRSKLHPSPTSKGHHKFSLSL